ncbi:MAG: hypothetical protein LBK66_06035 [Spirochaetaceae bacterium]|jgi:hypothetical protein|nr:hypothetical protein [Spirochaetaceae bacterium]
MKKFYKILGIIAVGAVIAIGITGCESTDWAVVADSLNTANNEFANSYSSSSESGLIYTIYNRSSETVYLQDLTGYVSIPPYGSVSARFGSGATIYDVYYSPSHLNVSQSGTTFTFTN